MEERLTVTQVHERIMTWEGKCGVFEKFVEVELWGTGGLVAKFTKKEVWEKVG